MPDKSNFYASLCLQKDDSSLSLIPPYYLNNSNSALNMEKSQKSKQLIPRSFIKSNSSLYKPLSKVLRIRSPNSYLRNFAAITTGSNALHLITGKRNFASFRKYLVATFQPNSLKYSFRFFLNSLSVLNSE